MNDLFHGGRKTETRERVEQFLISAESLGLDEGVQAFNHAVVTGRDELTIAYALGSAAGIMEFSERRLGVKGQEELLAQSKRRLLTTTIGVSSPSWDWAVQTVYPQFIVPEFHEKYRAHLSDLDTAQLRGRIAELVAELVRREQG